MASVQPYSDICKHFARSAAELEVASQFDFALLDSHFGLTPFAIKGDQWPVCKGCKHAMSFICQFQDDLSPPANRKKQSGSFELIELFLCGRCHELGAQKEGTWAVLQYAFPKTSDYAPIQPRHKIKASPVYQWLANVPYQAAPLKITLREKFLCMPTVEEFAEIASHSRSARAKKLLDAIEFSTGWEDTYETQVQTAGCRLPASSSQVGGYPMWMQGFESVKCRQCRGKMELYLQVDGYQCWIGADGFALLFRCSDHKDSFQLLVSAT